MKRSRPNRRRARRTQRSTSRPATPKRCFEPLEQRVMLAVITWDGGGDGETLTDPLNWDGDVLPGPGDDAIINIAANPLIRHTSGNFNARSLVSEEAFLLSGSATLGITGSIAAGFPSAFNDDLTMSGGSLEGMGDVTIGGNFTWSGGIMSGSGRTVFAGTATVTLSGGGSQRDIENAGAVTWTGTWGSTTGTGSTFTNLSTGTFHSPSGSNRNFQGPSASPGTFLNQGTFTKDGGTTDTFNNVAFINEGTVNTSAGELRFNDGGSSIGAMTASSGAVIRFNGGTFTVSGAGSLGGDGEIYLSSGTLDLDTPFNPTGLVRITNGTLRLDNAAAQTFADYTMTFGELTGIADLTITGTVTWSGGTMSGSGKTTFGATAVVALSGGGSQRDIDNAGAVTWTNTFGVTTGAGITFTNLATGTFSSPSGFNRNFQGPSASPGTFINQGTFTKDGGTTDTFANVAFINEGTLTTSAGELRFNDGGSSTGSMTASSGAVIRFNGGTFTVSGSGALTGDGEFYLSSGTLDLDTPFNPTGLVRITNGTLRLDNAAAQTFVNYTMTFGELTGVADLTITGTVTWSGGTMSGSGKTTFGATAVVALSGGGSQRDIDNAGTVTWTNTFGVTTGAGITFTNLATGTFSSPSGFNRNFQGPSASPGTFINQGTFTKDGGTSDTFANVAFINEGTLTSTAGTLRFDDGGSSTGTMTASSGAVIRFNGGTFTVSGSGALAGDGEFYLSSGTLDLDTPFNPTGLVRITNGTLRLDNAAAQTFVNYTMSFGELTGVADLTITGTVMWSGGTMSGSGKTTFGATAVVALSGGGSQRDIDNAGAVTWTGTFGVTTGAGITFTNLATGTFSSPSGFNRNFQGPSASPGTFINQGTFTKDGGTSDTFANVAFINEGTLTSTAGTLRFDDGGSSTGTMTASSGAVIRFNGGTFTVSGSGALTGDGEFYLSTGTLDLDTPFNPTGLVRITGGTLRLDNAAAQSFVNYTMTFGELTGVADLTITGTVTWSGGTMSGSGKTTFGATAVVALSGGGSQRDIDNAGTVTWTNTFGSTSGTGSTFTNLATGTFSSPSGFNRNFQGPSASPGTFLNQGTFTKDGGSTDTFSNVAFINEGTVNTTAGTLRFDDGGSSTGAMTASSGAVIRFNGGTFTVSGSGSLTGDGEFYLSTGTLDLDTPFNPIGLVRITGGTMRLDNAAAQTFVNYTMNAGELTGVGDLTITGTVNWTSGIMSGSGKTTFSATAVVALSGGGSERDIDNAGTVTWTGTFGSTSGTGSTFTNLATGMFTAPSGFNRNFQGPSASPATFHNLGTFVKQGADTVTFSNVVFVNDGAASADAGTVRLLGGAGGEGAWTLAPGVEARIAGTSAFADGASFVGDGEVRIESGTHTFTGTTTFSLKVTFANGTITGPGVAAFDGGLVWDGGSMTGSGSTTIAASTRLTMSTGTTKDLGRTLINNGRVDHTAGALRFVGGTLVNTVTRRYNASGTAQILSGGGTNLFDNQGVFNRLSGGTINIAVPFDNAGVLNIFTGIVNMDGGGTNTGARNVAAGSTLNYRASYTHGAGSTLAGSGSTNLDGGTQTISGNWTANTFLKLVSGTLDGPGTLTTTGPFFWLSGTMAGAGSVRTAGNGKLALSTSGAKVLSRDILNDGLLHYLNGSLTMGGATITNSAGRLFATLPGGTISAGGGTNAIINAGTLRKLGGDDLTFDGTGTGLRLNNTGMVDVRNGALNLEGPVDQVVGTTLTDGTWQVYPTGAITLGASILRQIGANATVIIVGGLASFDALQGMNRNNGTLLLQLGGAFAITPAGGTFINNGTIDMARSRALVVTGNYTQTAQGALNIDLQGVSNSLFSRVLASGTATLNGTVRFDFIGNFDPPANTNFQFITAASRVGTFATSVIPPLTGKVGVLQYLANGVRLRIQ